MKGSEFFLKSLKKLGINNIFGIVGGEAQFIKFNEENNIKFYLTRHEFTAGIIADVYGRLTGQPQVCYSTFGPGLTNLATGVFSAMQDRSPMLAVSAQIPKSEIAYNQTHQCLDNVSFMKTITKYSASIDDINQIPQLVEEALKYSLEKIPGPSYLSFPVNIMQDTINDEKAYSILNSLKVVTKTKALNADDESIKQVIAKISSAQNPIIIVGNELIRENLSSLFINLAESLNIHVICTLASKGIIPDDHKLFLTPCNKYLNKIYEEDIISQIFNNRDLILLFGYDFGEDLKPNLWKKNCETILINSFYNHIPEVFKPNYFCIGDLENTIKLLLMAKIKPKTLFSQFYPLKQKLDTRLPKNKISNIITTIRDTVGKDGIICSDIGLHKQFAGLISKTYETNTFLCSNVCGTFGFGLPAAIGAKIAIPNKKVILICGDGGFHSTSQDLETIIRYNLAIVIIVLKDNCFGLIKAYQITGHGDKFGDVVEFGNVNFVTLAEANGVNGINLSNIDELKKIIDEAFTKQKSLLVEIPVEYEYIL